MLPLLRLLQLASPALPVGAYTYSQGLEWAVEAKTITNESQALSWIHDQLQWNLGRYELPLLGQCLAAWHDNDDMAALALDADYLASRETAELRAETVQMGYSMRRLLGELEDFPASRLRALHTNEEASFLLVWSCAAATWQVPSAEAMSAWLWSWAENQVMAALKAVPLGQAAGQRILMRVGQAIPDVVRRALALSPDDFSNFAPGFSLACVHHETQYSRLFRS